MSRFVPAALLSVFLWALLIWGVQMGMATVGNYFGTLGGMLSIAFLR